MNNPTIIEIQKQIIELEKKFLQDLQDLEFKTNIRIDSIYLVRQQGLYFDKLINVKIKAIIK